MSRDIYDEDERTKGGITFGEQSPCSGGLGLSCAVFSNGNQVGTAARFAIKNDSNNNNDDSELVIFETLGPDNEYWGSAPLTFAFNGGDAFMAFAAGAIWETNSRDLDDHGAKTWEIRSYGLDHDMAGFLKPKNDK